MEKVQSHHGFFPTFFLWGKQVSHLQVTFSEERYGLGGCFCWMVKASLEDFICDICDWFRTRYFSACFFLVMQSWQKSRFSRSK